ncbi:MAG: endonuclease/exonuclease/phosphatase [Bacteroidetes bacterium]|nr:MAG: endonuclease/exonuclease/phosphatase [Bacteroidota bacterium]
MNRGKVIREYIRKGFLIFANPGSFIVAILFIVSGSAGYINPSENDLFAVAGLFYPLLFTGMIITLAISLILKSKLVYLQLLLLLISIPVSLRYIGFHPNPDVSGLKIMTYNVHGFKGFEKETDGKTTYESIISHIEKQNFDIVTLQEFRSWTGKIENDVKYFAQKAGFEHYHFTGYWRRGGAQSDGYLILSKLPIINSGTIPSSTKRNIGSFVDITKEPSQTIRIAGVHLISFSLGKQEIEAFGDAASLEMDLLKKHGRSLLGKLRNSFAIRASEVIDLQNFIKDCDLPLIVGGDFNDTPASYTYSKIIETGMKDTHVQSGFGLGATYGGKLPWLRIDYFFVSKQLSSTHTAVKSLPYSDHNPVQMQFISSKY